MKVELRAAGPGRRSRSLGPSEMYDAVVGDRVLVGAAQRYPEALVEGLRTMTTLAWSAFDTWLAEEEVIHTHARDPYVRVDAMPSSRHVRVVAGGWWSPSRAGRSSWSSPGSRRGYYLPRVDVRMGLLTSTDTVSYCAYKGTAAYWTLRVGELELPDVVWGYDTPLREGLAIAGLVCFWPEKSADLEVYVDGERIDRP